MKSIELFAGAGGLAFGTAEAGFRHKIVVEWDSNACRTLRMNRDAGVRHVRDWQILEEDVTHCDFMQYRDDVDFVCGGPPCQPFSMGGKHRAQADHRNMFPQAIRAVREIRPKAWMLHPTGASITVHRSGRLRQPARLELNRHAARFPGMRSEPKAHHLTHHHATETL